ncbi:uncharacterized protein PAC_19825 [Phialocephala subalpina]|uniref:C2H2-type domain-containing protein n=1 Tax=Phialocephala subalpina TaxID=576137 RepID=A0A1L7XY46_9HELO|nr:uncharacterized protein PAC_19825 [Phialocephala subalpina]
MEFPQIEGFWLSKSRKISGGRVFLSKRKTPEVIVNRRQPNIRATHQGGCIDAPTSDIQGEGVIPQKKQKLASEPRSCNEVESSLTCEERCIPSYVDPTDLEILVDPVKTIEVNSASPLYPDSEVSKSECHSSESVVSKSSSRTSRSSSLDREFQMGVSLRAQEQPTTNMEHEIQHMSCYISQCVEANDDRSFLALVSLDYDHPPLDQSCPMNTQGKVAPITSADQNHPMNITLGVSREPSQGNDMNSPSVSSRVTSPAPSSTFEDAASSIMDLDDPSTEGDKSSHSQSCSETSDSIPKKIAQSRTNKLESLIKDDVFRTNPEVAEHFYQAVKGKLECASPDDFPKYDANRALSLVELLELQGCGRVPPAGGVAPSLSSCSSLCSTKSSSAIVKCNIYSSPASNSDTTGSASGSGPVEGTHSSIGKRFLAGDVILGEELILVFLDSEVGSSNNVTVPDHNDKASDLQSKSQKRTAKPSSHTSQKQLLKCPFNVISPAMFCANPETKQKYRACAGPGWNTVAHLKEHLKSHHLKEEVKPNALQCSRCQKEFLSREELRSHDEDIDCPVTCLICANVFPNKEKRQQHRKQAHNDDQRDIFKEIGQTLWKTINDNLKTYTSTLKKAKGKGKATVDPDLERWVEANKPRFEVGRPAKAQASAKLELGQWYIIYTTMGRQNPIPEHPCKSFDKVVCFDVDCVVVYDYPISQGDLFEEKVLFIGDCIMAAKIKAGMYPPREIDSIEQPDPQRASHAYFAFYRGLFQETVRMAAKTKFSDFADGTFSLQFETLLASNEPSAGSLHNAGNDLSDTLPSSGQQLRFGHDGLSSMWIPSPGYTTNTPDQNTGVPINNVVNPSSELWLGQYSDEQLSLISELQNDFQGSGSGSGIGSGFTNNESYTGSWTGHSGPS